MVCSATVASCNVISLPNFKIWHSLAKLGLANDRLEKTQLCVERFIITNISFEALLVFLLDVLDCFTDCVAETSAVVNVTPVVNVEGLVVAEIEGILSASMLSVKYIVL